MFLRLIVIFFMGIFFTNNSIAQDIFPIGDWRDHLPYSDGISVSKNGSLVYCAANSAIFIYDEQDQSIERLNLVNGLSDIGISKIKYIPYNNRLIVAYINGNIDIILDDKTIYNIPFIKNTSTLGSKTINHIEVIDEFAYLSTGLGIIVLNTDKLEISDTYNYLSSGSPTTNAVAFDSINIYAASTNGVYFADKNSLNLSDFNTWNIIPELGNLNYNGVVFFANQLFASYDDPTWQSDTLFTLNSGIWEKFPATYIPKNITGLSVSDNKLIEIADQTLNIYNDSLNFVDQIFYLNAQSNLNAREAIISSNVYWVADAKYGLVKKQSNFNTEIIFPNGPSSPTAFKMSFFDDELWSVAGGYNVFQTTNLVNHKNKDSWVSLGTSFNDANGNTAFDMVSVAINPNSSSNVYVGSWSSGLYEYNNNQITNIYTAQNSVLDSSFFGSTAIGAMAFDEDNNLWVTSSFSNNILAVKKTDNTWVQFNFQGLVLPNYNYTELIIDDNNYKWIAIKDAESILVVDDNGALLNPNASFISKLLTPSNSDISGSQLNAMAKDLDGEIWIGTDQGIAVFYNPSEVFNQDIKAERIFIQQDGQTQILLEQEVITAIAVDGANRKWIGTQTSGVFLMSDDGTEEVSHFTTDNSPLFSNNILDIVINPENGEVFFGTEKGLISYKGTATEADEDFNNVLVYPNPVREDYKGTIAIKGLVADTDVRITDVNGNIVFQTTSLGGQAIWDGNDIHGNRIQSGVYLLFNGSQDGNKKFAAKILFIH
jgi:hypothetical protein